MNKKYIGFGVRPSDKDFFKITKTQYEPNPEQKIGNYDLVLNTPTVKAYLDSPSKTIMLSIRGTTDGRDVTADTMIPFNRLKYSNRYNEDKNIISNLATQYPPEDYDYYGTAHSLGVALLRQLQREFPFIKNTVGFNGAVQPYDIVDQKTNLNKSYYTEDDALYKLGGRLLNNKIVIPSTVHTLKIPSMIPLPSSVKIGQFGYNASQGHKLDNFEGVLGGAISRMRERLLKMTVKEIKEAVKNELNGAIKGYSRMKKEDLIDAIRNYQKQKKKHVEPIKSEEPKKKTTPTKKLSKERLIQLDFILNSIKDNLNSIINSRDFFKEEIKKIKPCIKKYVSREEKEKLRCITNRHDIALIQAVQSRYFGNINNIKQLLSDTPVSISKINKELFKLFLKTNYPNENIEELSKKYRIKKLTIDEINEIENKLNINIKNTLNELMAEGEKTIKTIEAVDLYKEPKKVEPIKSEEPKKEITNLKLAKMEEFINDTENYLNKKSTRSFSAFMKKYNDRTFIKSIINAQEFSDFYPTSQKCLSNYNRYLENFDKDDVILEPTAGLGSIVLWLLKNNVKSKIIATDYDPNINEYLKESFDGINQVRILDHAKSDYLDMKNDYYKYNPSIIFLNPPFSNKNDKKYYLNFLFKALYDLNKSQSSSYDRQLFFISPKLTDKNEKNDQTINFDDVVISKNKKTEIKKMLNINEEQWEELIPDQMIKVNTCNDFGGTKIEGVLYHIINVGYTKKPTEGGSCCMCHVKHIVRGGAIEARKIESFDDFKTTELRKIASIFNKFFKIKLTKLKRDEILNELKKYLILAENGSIYVNEDDLFFSLKPKEVIKEIENKKQINKLKKEAKPKTRRDILMKEKIGDLKSLLISLGGDPTYKLNGRITQLPKRSVIDEILIQELKKKKMKI